MSADSEAYKIIQSLPGLSPAEQQYLLTVARGEGFYGLGWGNPSPKTIADSALFGIDPKAGVGSNNWGAVQGTGNAGSFHHVDYHMPSGEPYDGIFKRYALPQDGASDVAKVLLKQNVREALSRGSMRDAVFAQKANRYFEASPESYLKAVSQNYKILTDNLHWTPALNTGGAPLPPLSSGQQSLPLAGSSSGEPSLHLGMVGDAVKLWQSVLGIEQDGHFGYITEFKTRVWQKQFHLVPDGIVGPLTWTKALGKE